MTNKTSKNIRICCFVALAVCLVWAVSLAVNTTSIMFGSYASTHPIDWSKNTIMKIVVLICYMAGIIAMIGMCIKAVFNTLKGLRENMVFPRSNEKLMFWIALADFIYLLGYWNLPILWKDDVVFQLQHTNFVTPFFLLFFAFMYKVAADAVEENNLTIWAMIVMNLDVMLAKRKMRSNELAERIGLTQANLSILKTGKAKAIRLSTLNAICRELQCTPGDILEYRADESTN